MRRRVSACVETSACVSIVWERDDIDPDIRRGELKRKEADFHASEKEKGWEKSKEAVS